MVLLSSAIAEYMSSCSRISRVLSIIKNSDQLFIMSVDPITCHILDTSLGKPAAGVTCSIFYISPLIADKANASSYDISSLSEPFAMSKTDNDGRIKKWVIKPGLDSTQANKIGVEGQKWTELKPGIYKIKFLTGKYFHELSASNRTFFPFVEITFQVENPPDHHYHVPLLLSNHSYSTYRGS